VQTHLQGKVERARQRERAEDDAKAVDQALAIVNAEVFRLWSIASEAQSADLYSLSRQGTLHPDDYQPADWSALMAACGPLGWATAALASYALTYARDTSLLVRTLIASRATSQGADPIVVQIRQRSKEAAALLEYALAHCPRSRIAREFDPDIPTTSEAGKRILEELKQRGLAQARSMPLGDSQS